MGGWVGGSEGGWVGEPTSQGGQSTPPHTMKQRPAPNSVSNLPKSTPTRVQTTGTLLTFAREFTTAQLTAQIRGASAEFPARVVAAANFFFGAFGTLVSQGSIMP